MRASRVVPSVVLAALFAACGDERTDVIEPELIPPAETADFGAVPVFNLRRMDLPIENAGRAHMKVHSVSIEETGTPFELLEWPGEVGSGTKAQIGVTFNPPLEQDYSATLVIRTDDEDEGEVRVSLIGKGSTRAIVEIEPASIDFGRVAEGTSAVKSVTLRSTGSADLILEEIAFVDGSSSAFQFLGSTTTPAVVPIAANSQNGLPGQVIITLRYTVDPDAPEQATANIRLRTTDPDRREVIVPVTGAVNRAPIAAIKPLGVGSPGLEVTLDGSESRDPDLDDPLKYKWTLKSKPLGSKTTIAGPEQQVTHMTLDPDLPGEYVVELNVTDHLGAKNLEPATASIISAPAQQLMVEMFWSETLPDIDLHFLNGELAEFGTDDDCHYMNPRPDWGVLGDDTDDPELVRDALVGFGPEVVGYVNPFAGTFRVVAYYQSTHRTDGAELPTDVTVRIYHLGVVRFEQKKTMRNAGEVWEVADVDWPSGVITSRSP